MENVKLSDSTNSNIMNTLHRTMYKMQDCLGNKSRDSRNIPFFPQISVLLLLRCAV